MGEEDAGASFRADRLVRFRSIWFALTNAFLTGAVPPIDGGALPMSSDVRESIHAQTDLRRHDVSHRNHTAPRRLQRRRAVGECTSRQEYRTRSQIPLNRLSSSS